MATAYLVSIFIFRKMEGKELIGKDFENSRVMVTYINALRIMKEDILDILVMKDGTLILLYYKSKEE